MCNKLLTKTILKIEPVDLSPEQFEALMKAVKISYGSQSKCRNCKKLRETLVVVP